MFGLPGLYSPADDNPNDPFTWSVLLYRTSAHVDAVIVARLLAAMKRKYGQKAKVHVAFYRDARKRRTLAFCCGEVTNVAEAEAFQRFVAPLVSRFSIRCKLLS